MWPTIFFVLFLSLLLSGRDYLLRAIMADMADENVFLLRDGFLFVCLLMTFVFLPYLTHAAQDRTRLTYVGREGGVECVEVEQRV